MTKKINSILKSVLEEINPDKKDLDHVDKVLKDFLKKTNTRIRKLKLDAEAFVGGSFAKNTVIKKEIYDVDIFIRFSRKYIDQNLSNLTYRILKGMKNVSKIRGSRDYFRVKISRGFYLEIVPVLKIKNAREYENITDLSYLHVRYVKNKLRKLGKLKAEKILNEIKIAKAFCYAKGVYGAESYIKGFSGYALELLVVYYGSFLKFLIAMKKANSEKIIIDIEKHYKSKKDILLDLNESKLESPIILIDPTYKSRNALAALSKKKFISFKKEAQKFLKNPSIKAFKIKKTDLEKIKKDAQKKKNEFILIEITTTKQEGDIAGSKLLKFYDHLSKEISQFYDIKNKRFNYNQKKAARCFFVVKSKKQVILSGPKTSDKKNASKFKKRHKATFVKDKRFYTKKKIDFKIKDFVLNWKKQHKKKLNEMSISVLKVI